MVAERPNTVPARSRGAGEKEVGETESDGGSGAVDGNIELEEEELVDVGGKSIE